MHSIKISTWNINGIRAILKKGSLKNYINHFSPEILCLNEIRIDEASLSKLNIVSLFPEYPYQNWVCSEKKGYSGVAILSKIRPLQTNADFMTDLSHFKGRVAFMEFNTWNLICVYSPNSGNNLQNLPLRIEKWEKNLRNSLNILSKPTILCGDLNVAYSEIDLFSPNTNHNNAGFTDKERENFGLLLKEGFFDCFREKYQQKIQYTWWSPRSKTARQENKGWRLDYFLMKYNHSIKLIDCLIRDDVYGSDHCPVELMIDPQN